MPKRTRQSKLGFRSRKRRRTASYKKKKFSRRRRRRGITAIGPRTRPVVRRVMYPHTLIRVHRGVVSGVHSWNAGATFSKQIDFSSIGITESAIFGSGNSTARFYDLDQTMAQYSKYVNYAVKVTMYVTNVDPLSPLPAEFTWERLLKGQSLSIPDVNSQLSTSSRQYAVIPAPGAGGRKPFVKKTIWVSLRSLLGVKDIEDTDQWEDITTTNTSGNGEYNSNLRLAVQFKSSDSADAGSVHVRYVFDVYMLYADRKAQFAHVNPI